MHALLYGLERAIAVNLTLQKRHQFWSMGARIAPGNARLWQLKRTAARCVGRDLSAHPDGEFEGENFEGGSSDNGP
jgi:hypothetical protein